MVEYNRVKNCLVLGCWFREDDFIGCFMIIIVGLGGFLVLVIEILYIRDERSILVVFDGVDDWDVLFRSVCKCVLWIFFLKSERVVFDGILVFLNFFWCCMWGFVKEKCFF